MYIKEQLEQWMKKTLADISIDVSALELDRPADLSFGQYSSNIALAQAKKLGENPKALAEKMVSALNISKPEEVASIEIAGPGFINMYLTDTYIAHIISTIVASDTYGHNTLREGQKAIFEYTDPNPFKQFHIGHLMSNAIGESLSRLAQWSGADVKRANYQGDVGLHVAKTIWGMQELSGQMPHNKETLTVKAEFLGKTYVHGSNAYEEDESAKKEIDALNKVIFEKSDVKVMELYDWGRKVSLDYFELIYAKLGTRFDYYFFESEVAKRGMFVVDEFLKKGIFEKSDGAVVFKGEQYGLHTRVFINSQGLPTYETKEIGLNIEKFDRAAFDLSVIITASEQNDYFKVVLKALEFIDSNIANRTRHIGHGMLRFASGKMSSRKGNVITGESLIVDVEKLVYEKIQDREQLSAEEKTEVMSSVAVGAIKYSILKQSPGKDIIFDMEKSLSFEGDSGPYLQYAHARAFSILEKAKAAGIEASVAVPDVPGILEKMLVVFPDVVFRAEREQAPQLVVTYLTELAGTFNAYYANTPIVLENDIASPYRVALTKAFAMVMKNGLFLLGIDAPEKM